MIIESDRVSVASDRDRARTRRGCFGGMRSDGEKDGSDPILTRTPLATAYAAHFVRGICHFAERLDGTGKM